MLSNIWLALGFAAVFFGIWFGRLPDVSTALLSGASEGVRFILTIGGVLCFWSGVLEVLTESGLSAAMAKKMRPLLSRLFPRAAKDGESLTHITANITANILGLGNAATPAGIAAMQALQREQGGERASREICLFVMLNAASVQLLPTTVISIRAGLGSAAPFEILPAVWLTTAVALAACIALARLFERTWRS